MGRGGFGFMGEKNKLVNRNGNENQNQKAGTSLLSLLVLELLLCTLSRPSLRQLLLSFLNQNVNGN